MILILNYKFPSLNDYTNKCRANKYAGASMKKELTDLVTLECKRQKLPKIDGKVNIHFKWIEKNKKRDMDNICSAKKFALDGLVNAGVIVNDTWEYINGFKDTFELGKENAVIVEIEVVK